jgi:O-antigen/teichoic acid export membrane protein
MRLNSGSIHVKLKGHSVSQLPSFRLRIVKNVSANWLGLFTAMVVGFFLTPFILHRLGNVAFGLWVLMTTFTGYYGLLDLGFRNAIIRYVARFAARQESESLSRVASTALFTYSALGLLVLPVTGLIIWKLDSIFHLTPEWSHPAKTLLLVFGIGTAIGFPLNVFGGILEGLQQFTWIGTVQAVSMLVRAALIVLALKYGGGLIAIGLVKVVVNVISSAIYIPAVFRLRPDLRLHWAYSEKSTLRLLGSFGLITFWIGIGQKLRFSADGVVIGSFLSVQAISFFSIGAKLVFYLTDIVQSMAQIFTPMFSHFDAQGDLAQLRHLLIRSNRYSSMIIFPLTTVMLVLGKTIIRVWVGPGYESSYAILAILMVPSSFYLAQAGSTKVLYGMGRHAFLAWLFLLEGIVNLVLSIILLHWYGIAGVALGTAIPLTVTSLFLLPPYVTRLLDLRMMDYLWKAHVYPLLLSAPLALVLWKARIWVQAENYAGLILQMAMGGIVYAVGAAIFLYYSEGLRFWRKAVS